MHTGPHIESRSCSESLSDNDELGSVWEGAMSSHHFLYTAPSVIEADHLCHLHYDNVQIIGGLLQWIICTTLTHLLAVCLYRSHHLVFPVVSA